MKTMLTVLLLFSIIFGVIGLIGIFPTSTAAPKSSVQETIKRRNISPIGRAYLAARIAKTLRHMGYPTKWTILNDVYEGSPVILLECSKFSKKAIAGFIDRGILADLYFESFDRVDFFNGSHTWSYELNQSHRRETTKGKLYLFASELTDAEFDQVDKQFFKSHGLPAPPKL
jgi:YHS domain-containing protein